MEILSEGWRFVRQKTLPPIIVLPRPDKIWYFQQTRLFHRLSEVDLRRLAQISEMHEYHRGQVILSPHHDPDRIYFVKTGWVKISTYSLDGKEQILALLEPGDLFDELAPAEPPETVRVEAFSPNIVCTLHRASFDVIKKTPEVALQVIRVLARRMRAAEKEIEDLALRDVPGRVASVLLRMGEEYGERHDRGIRLTFRLTHQGPHSRVDAGNGHDGPKPLPGRWSDHCRAQDGDHPGPGASQRHRQPTKTLSGPPRQSRGAA